MFVWVVAKNSMLAHSVCKYLKKCQIKYIATGKDEVNVLNFVEIQNFATRKALTHIINCSAYTDVEKAEFEKKICYAINVNGVENLALVAKNLNIKLIHYSTDYVFDGKNNRPYLEDDLKNPINYYGYTKSLSEDVIESILCRYLIIRTSWLFGYYKLNFCMKMLKLMQKNLVINVIDDQFGRATFCDDLAVATLTVINQTGVVHFANENALSWYGFALAIFNNLKEKRVKLKCKQINPIKTKYFETNAKRPGYSVLNTKKYEKLSNLKIRNYTTCLEEYFLQNHDIY